MPTLTPIDYQPDFGDFYEATGADKPTFQPKTKLLAETLFNAAPTIFKPAIAMASALPKAIEAFKEGFNKSGAAGLKSYAEALENQYVPEGAVKFDDSGQYYDKDGNKLKTQYRPNILPWTRGEGGIPEFAMPAMADVWNTLGGPGGIAKEVVLGAGPSLRPALKYMDKIYKAKPGEQHLDAIPKELQDIFQKQALSGEDISNFNFGFINHKGQFLQREDALKYAIDNGILDPQDAKYGTLVTTMLNKSGGEGKLLSQGANYLKDKKYPMAPHSDWWGQRQFEQQGGRLELMSPDDFLNKSRPLKIDESSRENIEELKNHILKGKKLDPLNLQQGGREDGRHRAIAAKELGIEEVPVINFRADSGGEGKLASTFFSALEDAVGKVNQNKASGEQWLGTLSNAKGVKGEELEYTGLKEFLKDKKNITKQEIQDYLKNNKVKLQEVWKGGHKKWTQKDSERLDELENLGHRITDEQEIERQALITRENEATRQEGLNGGQPTITKYHSYQLPGGNTNYRELLLTLPVKTSPKTQEALALTKRMNDGEFNSLDDAARQDLFKKRDKLLKEGEAEEGGKPYKSSHWDEPNILAHMRMNDRTIDGKKSLHLEEIQSDWHQQGREKGYKSKDAVKKYDDLINQKGEAAKELNAIEKEIKTKIAEGYDVRNLTAEENSMLTKKYTDTRAADERWVKAREKFDNIEREIQKGNPNMGVPDAPFKKTWHELALKRAIREAAEGGYERLSWTPGEAQALRYPNEMRKVANSIKWHNKKIGKVDADGNKQILIDMKDGSQLELGINKEGIVITGIEKAKGKSLSEIIGKDMAKDILNKDEGNIAGKDFIVGGEGMKGFYDQIIPKSIEKIAKEFGVKVQKSNLPNADNYKIKRTGDEYDEASGASVFHIFKNGSFDKTFKTRKEAEDFVKNVKGNEIFYIDIPENMRKSVMQKGQPLFSGVNLTPVSYEPDFGDK